ncbi:MAG: CBS domain-containing protein, partial [Caldilineaceae bacterium]|nr:CBS domain-containing protein [Caldilineaceae bacterium]
MTLESELRAEKVIHLDLSGFSTASAETPVHAVVARMRAEKHNVCLITADHDKLVGIFTDRDILTKVVDQPDVLTEPISNVMTPNPVTVTTDMSAADALRLMQRGHFRNLPVLDGAGKILGDMTHQSILDYLAARYPIEVLNLPPDPERFPRKP